MSIFLKGLEFLNNLFKTINKEKKKAYKKVMKKKKRK